MARGPSRKTQWDSNPQPLNTCMSGGAGSTTELSPTPVNRSQATPGQYDGNSNTESFRDMVKVIKEAFIS